MFSAREVSVLNQLIHLDGAPVPGSGAHRWDHRIEARLEWLATLHEDGLLPRLAGTTALIDSPGMGNYFHWMVEAMPRLVRLRHYLGRGIGPIDRILVSNARGAPFIAEFIEAFFPDLLPRIEIVGAIRNTFEHALFFLDERSGQRERTRIGTTTALFAEALDARLADLPAGSGPAVMISRQDVGTRCLVNEAEVAAALAPLGVRLVVLETMPLADKMRLMARAPLLIGVHGAGLANMMFCRPGTAVVELTSTQFMLRATSYADLAAFRGLRYGLAVADQRGSDWVIRRNVGNDLEVADDRLAALRGLAESLMARGSRPTQE